MFTINKNVCELTSDKKGLVTEASTAGMPPGYFPDFVTVLDDNDSGFLYQKGKADYQDDGDIAGMNYYDMGCGSRLLIIND